MNIFRIKTYKYILYEVSQYIQYSFFEFYLSSKVLKEAPSGALVELRHRVPQHPEDDGLRGGEDQREQPGHDHHQPGCQHYKLSSTSSNPIFSKAIQKFQEIPGSLPLSRCVQTGQRITDADEP